MPVKSIDEPQFGELFENVIAVDAILKSIGGLTGDGTTKVASDCINVLAFVAQEKISAAMELLHGMKTAPSSF